MNVNIPLLHGQFAWHTSMHYHTTSMSCKLWKMSGNFTCCKVLACCSVEAMYVLCKFSYNKNCDSTMQTSKPLADSKYYIKQILY